jgi:hypothetical protein
MRRAFAFTAAVVAACTIAVAAQQPAAPVADNWMPTEIKNLTVLPKNMPPAEVMKVMRAWNAALNVDCVFCHVGQVGKPLSSYDFVSDNKKRKDVSRLMLKASTAMNEAFKSVDSDEPPSVQCSTCHKRSRHVDADLPPEKPKDPQH